ncbi:MAG: LLM class flavin-dependent oxidoreductase [Rhizobiaceae bacterium]
MATHFVFAPTPSRQAGADVPFFFDIDRAAGTLIAVEHAGFDSLLVDDAGGDLANFDVASRLTQAVASLTLQLSHSATSMDPLSTVRSLSMLARHALAAPTLRVRVEAGDGDHVEAWRRTDEYLLLLKRLWLNDLPIEHEGAFYHLRSAFIADKAGLAGGVPLWLSDTSGIALEVSARHADVIPLPADSPDTLRLLIERVRGIAATRGRTRPIGFGVTLRLTDAAEDDRDPDSVLERVSALVDLGVSHFTVTGTNDPERLRRLGDRLIAPLRRRDVRRADSRPLRANPGPLANAIGRKNFARPIPIGGRFSNK